MMKKFITTTILSCLLCFNAFADNIKKISVEGNMRIEEATVKSYLKISSGDEISPEKLDASIKSLFATGLFSDVSIDINGNNLVVKVVENPIVNQIAFEGNDRTPDEDILSEIFLKPRMVYTKARVKKDTQRIIEIYRRKGRFSVSVEPNIIKREYNRVDLIFKINEGAQTYISTINFVGNNKFSSKKLKEELMSKEERWYRFFSQTTTYDPDRADYDKELLRTFYLNKGYYDINISTVIAELTKNEESFFLTFKMNEGIRYKFGKIEIINHIPHTEGDMGLVKEIEIKDGDWFDQSRLDDNIQKINTKLGEMGYAFVDINPMFNKVGENKLNINLVINETQKVYINKINIHNNSRTVDKVIRREFKVEEGDAFNVLKIKKSRQNVENLNFFSKVDLQTKPSQEATDKVDVDLTVEEKPTGSMTFSVGYSTDSGPLTEFGINESNLLGKAYYVGAKASLSQKKTNFDISFANPYIFDKDLYFGTSVYYTIEDRSDESSYDLETKGFTNKLGWKYTDHLSHFVTYTLRQETFTNVKNNASYYVKNRKKDSLLSMPGHTLTYDTRDSKVNPTSGYMLSYGNDFAGLVGDYDFVRTDLSGTYYYPVTDDITFALNGNYGYIWGNGGEVPINHRYFLGGDNLRGFESAGVGARDARTMDSLGGIWQAYGKAQVTTPIGFPPEIGIKGKIFSDFGTIGKPLKEMQNDILYSSEIRVSAGLGILWVSPMGPINIDFAKAIQKEDYDKTQVFRLSFSTGI